MTLSLSSCLHYWSARYGSIPVVGGNPVMARNSAGRWVDQKGQVQSAIVNTPRFETADLGDGAGRRPVMRLEQARMNIVQYPPSAYNSDGATVSTGYPDPFGGSTAIKSTYTGSNGRVTLPITYTGNGTKSYTLLIAPIDTTASIIRVFDVTAGATKAQFTINWNVGGPSVVLGVGSGLALGGDTQLVGDFWAIRVTADSIVAANSNRFEVLPDLNNTGKSAYIGGLSVEDIALPSSFIIPLNSTRAIDEFYWGYTPAPQALMAYVRFIERGTLAVPSTLLGIGGNAAGGDPKISIYSPGSGVYRAYHNNGSSSVACDAVGGLQYGETIELVLLLTAGGAVQLLQSRSGAAVTANSASSNLTLAAAWADRRIYLAGASWGGISDFAELKIVKYADVAAGTNQGIMDELRAFELDSRGAIL